MRLGSGPREKQHGGVRREKETKQSTTRAEKPSPSGFQGELHLMPPCLGMGLGNAHSAEDPQCSLFPQMPALTSSQREVCLAFVPPKTAKPPVAARNWASVPPPARSLPASLLLSLALK